MVKSELDKVHAGLSSVGGEAAMLKTTLLGLTGGLSAAAFAGWVRGTIDAADAMNDLSQRVGIAVKDLAAYELAAKQSGTSMDAIARGVKGLSGVMATNSDAMKAAGITATDTDGAMQQLATLFSKMPDGMEKTNLAVKIFGKSGMDLIPMLNLGAAGLKEAAEKSAKYAEQMAIMAPLADAFNDNMAEIAMHSKVMGMTMMNDALPAMLEITRAMADGAQKGGTFAGIMAGLAVGFENYKKDVREFYGMKQPSTGGADGSWAPDKPKVDTSAKFKAEIKELLDALNKPGAGSADKVSEYARITQEITKTNAVSAQELLYGSKLAASDKYRVEMMAKVEAAYTNNKISMTERIKLTEGVTAASAQMYLVEKQAFEADAIKKNTEAVDKLNEATLKTIESLVAGNEQKRLENEIIGLTAEAVNTLTLKRLDANIAEEKSNLISLQNAGAGAAEIAQMERKISLLEQQRNLTDISQNKTAYANVKTTVLGDAKPAASSYDPRELAGIIGSETEKVAAYNATARVVLANAEAQLAIDRALASSSHELTAAEVERFTSLQAEIDKIRGNLELNFKVAGLDDMSDKLSSMSATAGKLGDEFKGAAAALGGFSSGLKTIAKAQADQAKSGRDSTAEQIGGYGEIAGAAKEMFDKNSAGYELMAGIEKAMYVAKFAMQAMEVVGNLASGTSGAASTAMQIPGQIALAEVAGTVAVLTQGEGDPYTAWIRMAAMAAAVAGILAAIGGSGGSMSGGGGGGGGGGSGGANADGSYIGSGSTVNANGQVTANRPAGSGGESGSAQQEYEDAQAAYEAADAVNKVNLSLRKLQAGASALEQDLIDVKLATQGAGAAQYELATQGMDGSEKAAYNYNTALKGQITVLLDVANGTENASKNMKSLAGDIANLEVDLLRSSGNIAAANQAQFGLDTAGFTADEVAMYSYKKSLEDQIAANEAGASAASDAANAEHDLAQKRYELANVINVMLGKQTQLEADRAAELAGVTDAQVIALTNLRNALEDVDANITKLIGNADTAFATLERAVKAERDALTKAYKAAGEAHASQADSLKELNSLASALKSTLSSIDIDIGRKNAQAQIAMFLAIAKAGGPLPTLAAIDPALKAIAKPGEDLFATFVDYQRDQIRTANDIADLSKLATGQVSIEQQTLDTLKGTYDAEMERLDGVLTSAQLQLDVLHGIDNSVISVAGAIVGMAAAFGAAQAARDGADAARAAAVSSSGANLNYAAPTAASGGGGGGGYYGGGGTAAEYETIAGQTNRDIVNAYHTYYKRNPDAGGYETYSRIGLSGDTLMQAILGGSAGDPNGADFLMARSRGYDPLNPAANYLHSQLNPSGGGSVAPDTSFSYAGGSNYIPFDQVAQVHAGEEITPRPYVDMQRASRDETNALMRRLVQSNEDLRVTVDKQQATLDKIERGTSKSASILTNVTRDGNALLTEAA